MSFQEKWPDFKSWYEDFESKHSHSDLANEAWFDKVQEQHQAIRELIGGIRLGRKVNLQAAQDAADEKACKPLFAQLENILPTIRSNIPDENMNKLLMPTISLGSHKALRTGKAINSWASNILHNDRNKAAKLKQVNNIVAKLGQYWARSRTDNVEHDVLLTTSARAFALLGHYGPDGDSCFKQGSGNQHFKYNLAQCENSYVLLIKNAKSRNIARMWGFPSKKFDVFNICNVYFKEGVQEGNMIETLKSFFGSILKTNIDEMRMFENKIDVGEEVYQNDYGNWSFTALDKIGHQVLNTDHLGFKCPHCDEKYDNQEDWGEVDEEMVCENCVDKANICDISDKRSFKETVQAVDQDGRFQDAFLETLKSGDYGTYHKCTECGDEPYYHESQVTQVGSNRFVCNDCKSYYYERNKKRVYGYSRK